MDEGLDVWAHCCLRTYKPLEIPGLGCSSRLRSFSISIQQLDQRGRRCECVIVTPLGLGDHIRRLLLRGFLAVESILRAKVAVCSFILFRQFRTDEKGNRWTPEGSIVLCRDPTVNVSSNPNFAMKQQTEVKTM